MLLSRCCFCLELCESLRPCPYSCYQTLLRLCQVQHWRSLSYVLCGTDCPAFSVASFFDTPIFNFPIPTNHEQTIVPLPFWTFWSVSIGLTLVLILGWLGYLRRSSRIDRQERDLERQQLGERIRKRQVGGPVAMLLEGRTLANANDIAVKKRWTLEDMKPTKFFRSSPRAENVLFGMTLNRAVDR